MTWLYVVVSAAPYVARARCDQFSPIISEKYLQAAQALSKARLLDAEHPELHVRAVEFRRTGIASRHFLFSTTYRFFFMMSLIIPPESSRTYRASIDRVPVVDYTGGDFTGNVQFAIFTEALVFRTGYFCCR